MQWKAIRNVGYCDLNVFVLILAAVWTMDCVGKSETGRLIAISSTYALPLVLCPQVMTSHEHYSGFQDNQ